MKWFEENFEIAEVTISLDRVLECSCSSAVNMERKELIKLLKGLGYKYDKNMRGFGEKMDKNGKKQRSWAIVVLVEVFYVEPRYIPPVVPNCV